MRLLALDTSSIACSVAVAIGDTIAERHDEQPREHTRILLPMIRAVVDEVRVSLADLDAIVLGNGPGSFIGMRIAASVAQGMAYASGLPIVPVSSLAAVAAQVFAEHAPAEVVVTQDAHMHEVYLGVYRDEQNGLPIELIPERLSVQEPIPELETRVAGPRLAAGRGWQRYPDLLACNRDRIADVVDILHPRARFLLGLGDAALASGKTVEPHAVAPAYLRQKVAVKPATAT